MAVIWPGVFEFEPAFAGQTGTIFM